MIAELVKNTKQFYATLSIALIVFVFILSIAITLSAPLPIGSDPYFHLEIARLYGTGNFTGAFNYITSVNQIPFYPPLWQTLLIPIAISPWPLEGLRIITMFAMPLTFLFTSWLLWKQSGPKAAFIAGLVLLGSWSFIDGVYQARPETLDLMFYPLMLMMILAVKKKTFAGLALATIYSHGVMAVMNIWGWIPRLLKEKEQSNSVWGTQTMEQAFKFTPKYRRTWLSTIALVTAISSPILILTALFFAGGWSMWATTAPQENPQETLFWTNPSWIPFYAGITIIGFAFCFTGALDWFKRRSLTELQTYLLWGLLGNIVMLPLWADRWLQYSTIPLACLVGLEVAKWHNKKLYATLAVIAVGAWIYISFFLFNTYTHNWFQPGAFAHQ